MKKVHCDEDISSDKESCDLCKKSENCLYKYGEKITLKQHNLTVHYFCLLVANGIYQRGEENEGIYGFLVEDVKQEVRRASRLICTGCKKKGASVGCNVKSCKKKTHFPCGSQLQFLFQFTGLYASFCKEHSPTQTQPLLESISMPLSCSVCLEDIEPVLSYFVLKCPACHGSWFHRDCVQHQAQSAGLFFFKCNLCSNKDLFQNEMLRMGIHIPERDASWELEENAYGELLQVYQHCDAPQCFCTHGRNYSTKVGKYELVRCKLCGSSGTHRECSYLTVHTKAWTCTVCSAAVEAKTSLSRQTLCLKSRRQRQERQIKRSLTTLQSGIDCKRSSLKASSAMEILQDLARQISQHLSKSMLVIGGEGIILEAALALLKQRDFSPKNPLSVRFASDKKENGFNAGNTRHFLRLLMRRLQNCPIFEGPAGEKSLALSSQALCEDMYFDIGCLLSLSLVHGGPPVGFFTRGLYQCLFDLPRESPLTVDDMGDNIFRDKVKMIQGARTLTELKEAMESASEYLEVSGCLRQVDSLLNKDRLVEDMVNFHLVTRLQLPMQRLRDGLKTLGVFEQVQMFPELFRPVFCFPPEDISAQALADLFTPQFSDSKERNTKENTTVSFWRRYLNECQVGKCATSLEDVLIFATSAAEVPAAGFKPSPTLAFVHPHDSTGRFPESNPSFNQLMLPVLPDYDIFKKYMEYAVGQLIVTQCGM